MYEKLDKYIIESIYPRMAKLIDKIYPYDIKNVDLVNVLNRVTNGEKLVSDQEQIAGFTFFCIKDVMLEILSINAYYQYTKHGSQLIRTKK